MKFKLIIFILFCGLFNCALAQTLISEGMITNAQNHQPVPYAALGIKGKNIGTIADENGVFRLHADQSAVLPGDEIIVSSVGFNPRQITLAKLQKSGEMIALTPLPNELKAVTIKPLKFKTKVYGRTGNSTIMTANMFTERNLINDNLGKEQAAILPVDKHCYLKNFNMLVAFNRFRSVKFRLNIYNVKDGQPDQLIVNQDILFDVTQKNGWLKVNLTPYQIYLDGYKEIAVAIQWVKSVKADTTVNSAFGVSVAPVPFRAMYFRNKSQADWKKISPAYVAFNVTADSFKQDKDDHEVQSSSEAALVLSDSLQNYLTYTKYAQEAQASGYGANSKVGKYLNLPDARLYYEVYGTGQPLLLLHGNGSSISSFYKQIPELAKHYQVIAVDTRAQGNSTDAGTGPLSYEMFASDMKLLLDSLHIRQANILGWSDGGNTGLIMAVKYPSYVKKLAIMGAVLSPQGVEPTQLDKFRQSLANAKQQGSNQRRLLTLLVTEPHLSNADLETIKVPVLVMAGEKDIVLSEHTRQIADNIADSKLQIIKDATHYAPQEKPDVFNAAVLSFLKP